MEGREGEEQEKMKGSETNPLCPTTTSHKRDQETGASGCCLEMLVTFLTYFFTHIRINSPSEVGLKNKMSDPHFSVRKD